MAMPLLLTFLASLGLGLPAHAWSIPSRSMDFRLAAPPKDALERLRSHAIRQGVHFKFPFEYKNAVYLTDRTVPNVTRIETCARLEEAGSLSLQVRVWGGGSVFADSLDAFDFREYVEKQLKSAFAVQRPAIQVIGEIPGLHVVCEEMREIEWPARIH